MQMPTTEPVYIKNLSKRPLEEKARGSIRHFEIMYTVSKSVQKLIEFQVKQESVKPEHKPICPAITLILEKNRLWSAPMDPVPYFLPTAIFCATFVRIMISAMKAVVRRFRMKVWRPS